MTASKRLKAERLKACLDVISLYPELMHQEEQMDRTPFDVKGWTLYFGEIDDLLDHLRGLSATTKNKEKMVTIGGRNGVRVGDAEELMSELVRVRRWVAERATHLLPGSYKLWRNYLLFCKSLLKHDYVVRCSEKELGYNYCIKQFETALVRLSKMPRLWLDYVALVAQHHPTDNCTSLRRLFNRALEALPVTQHDKIWKVCIDDWLGKNVQSLVPESILRLRRRHAHYFDPTARESLANLCEGPLQRPGEAAMLYLQVLNDTTFISPNGTTKAELWMTMANLCTKYPQETQAVGIDFEALVRGAMDPKPVGWQVLEEEEEAKEEDRSSGELRKTENPLAHLGELEGTLWAKLADYYIRQGDFDMARSIYEEGMDAVNLVRDFSILFDAYIKLEEGVMEAMIVMATDDDDEEDGAGEPDPQDWDILLGKETTASNLADMELAMSRAEHLTKRRPLLLNRVLLKQNPHNVGEWVNRSQLYQKQEQANLACAALEEGLKKVHARKAINGTPSEIVLELAKLYSVDKARDLFERICNQMEYVFRDADDLAQCWAAWIELELKEEQWDNALSLARQSVASADPKWKMGSQGKLAHALPKSLRLWDLRLDLEESLGTVATTKDSYNRALDLRVATTVHVINYASFLKEQKYFEESFAAYERGVDMFQFPAAKLLWKNYLDDFIGRYGGSKVERVRDLFSRCLQGCPPDEASEFFMMNGRYEEQHGLTKRALSVYKQMCATIPKQEEKVTAYKLYIAKTTKYMGLTATRDIYEEAIQELGDEAAAGLCLEFSKMEESLQELDRARAVLVYGAQMADPRRLPDYWTAWHAFEVAHGNEETFREMLRVKRSVQASFSTVNYNATGMSEETTTLTDDQAMEMLANQEGVELTAAQKKGSTQVEGFVPSVKKRPAASMDDVEERVSKLRKATGVGEEQLENTDEIDIDDDDVDDDDGPDTESVQNVTLRAVPSAVFGELESSS